MRLRALSVAAVLLLAGPASAQDRPPAAPGAGPGAPASPVAERVAAAGRASAAKLWPAVADARRNALFEFAVREAERVLALDPDHREARALLGYVRREGAWVEDAALAAKTPRTNFPGKAPPLEQAAAVEKRWVEGVRGPARAAAAAVWTALGSELSGEDSAAAHRRAIELDPGAKRSRAALGQYAFHGAWLSEAQVRAAETAARAEAVDVESPADKAFGVKLSKVRSGHFRLESRIPADRLAEIARWLEIAYAVHLAETGRDPASQVFPSEIRMVLCESDAEWNRFVDTFVPSNREFLRGLDGSWAADWTYGMRPPKDGTDETRRDHLVHRAVHAVDSFAIGLPRLSWADEGLAHLTTIRVQGMTRTWCVAPDRSDYAKLDQAGGKAGWIDEKEWRATTRAAALARDDVPLRTLVLQDFPGLGFAAVLKAWSVLDWLRTEDPGALRALLPKLRNAKDSGPAIEQHFGRGLEALDEEWRRWVLRTY